ncbi:MAG: trans-sulfuration enzyme family protein [Thermogutta sp.]
MSNSPRPASPLSPDTPRLATLCVHGGEDRFKPCHSITDPVFFTATYTFPNTAAVLDYVEKKLPRDEYGRYSNPTERVLEQKLAAIEGGESAIAFATGMAAVTCYLMSKVRAGDEIVLFDECYHRSREFCTKVLGKFGVVTHQIPACDYEKMEAAINPRTKLLISESPTNPHLSVVDLERFAAIGKKHGVETMIDATLATPYNVRPLEYGVDCVLHSCTKYLGGHNDLLAGAVIGRREVLEPVRKLRGVMGVNLTSQSAYLLLRGLKTFELRMARHNQNGMALAQFLERHPRVEKVFYPGLPSHRDYEIARRTMRGFGGLVTFLVRDADAEATARIVDAVRIPHIGPSLGGAESLIEQPIFMSYHDFTMDQRRAVGILDNMIRVSCGLEDTEDLIADFAQALDH